jgi:hypothetical protein
MGHIAHVYPHWVHCYLDNYHPEQQQEIIPVQAQGSRGDFRAIGRLEDERIHPIKLMEPPEYGEARRNTEGDVCETTCARQWCRWVPET